MDKLVNHKIKYKKDQKIRLVFENKNSEVSTMGEAIQKSKKQNLDLVLMNNNQDLPVIKLCDYDKLKYKEKKIKEENKKKQRKKNKPVKQIRFSPNISSNDKKTKLNKVEEFLKKGHKVKIELFFKGRTIKNNFEDSKKMLLEIAVSFEDISKLQEMPKTQNRKMFMTLIPKKEK